MTVSKHVLECPFCHELFDVEAPDEFHTAYSVKKPLPDSFYADVIETTHTCQNPNCKKTFTVYWYAPLDYFNRL